MTQYQAILSSGIGPTFESPVGPGTLAIAIFAVFMTIFVVTAIMEFRRAYVLRKKAKRGLIADDPEVYVARMNGVRAGVFLAFALSVILWFVDPDLLTGAIDLNAIDLKKAAGREPCGVERLCTLEDLAALGWDALGKFLFLASVLREILFCFVLGWIVYEVIMTIPMPEPAASKRYWKLAAVSAVFFTVVLATKPLVRMVMEAAGWMTN